MASYEDVLAYWHQLDIRSEAALAKALGLQSVSFAYHSGKIENPQITFKDTRDIFDHDGVTSYTGDLRTLLEIRNARDAHALFLFGFGKKKALDEELILRFQHTYDARRYQLGERPGAYKLHDYVTGRRDIGAAPEDVAEEMAEVLSEIHEAPPEKALTVAAYFHAKFENIHPFADGSGRCGRITMNYYLVTSNHPPVTIHEEDRRGYFEALEAWDKDKSLDPLKNYLREQTVKTWEASL